MLNYYYKYMYMNVNYVLYMLISHYIIISYILYHINFISLLYLCDLYVFL